MIYLLVYLLMRKKALVVIFTSVVNPGVTASLPIRIKWIHSPLPHHPFCNTLACICQGERNCGGWDSIRAVRFSFLCKRISYAGEIRIHLYHYGHGPLCLCTEVLFWDCQKKPWPAMCVGGTAPAFQMQWAECPCSLSCCRQNTPGNGAVPLRTQPTRAAL